MIFVIVNGAALPNTVTFLTLNQVPSVRNGCSASIVAHPGTD